MIPQILAQVFGFGALLTSIVIYSRKNKKSMLICKAVQDSLWGIHYLLLACYSAAGTSAVCIVRSFVFYHRDKQRKAVWWVLVFFAFYAVSAALTWQNAYSLLPALASCTSTVAFFMKKPEHTKMLQIVASLITLSYNILQSHSLTVYFGVAITVTTAVISLIQYYKNQKTYTPKA